MTALEAATKWEELYIIVKDHCSFTDQILSCSRTTIEQLANEFNSLDTKIKKIKSQIQLSSTESDIQEQMAQFLQVERISNITRTKINEMMQFIKEYALRTNKINC